MMSLFDFLQEQETTFPASLGQTGGYIQFYNSGQRGEQKSFHISLDALNQTLIDIREHLDEFTLLQEYKERSWRDSSIRLKDGTARAMMTVQTKPLFSTLSKLIRWANPDKYEGKDSDQEIILTRESLDRTIDALSAVIQTYTPTSNRSLDISKGEPQQTIYFGCPGTGKSYRIARDIKERGVSSERVFRTTFHPDTDYASFVGCYKPIMEEELTYAFRPQVFTDAYVCAWESPEEDVFMVVEEINRGNCAQIFGDLFQLLDRGSNGYSIYPIRADKELEQYLRNRLGDTHQGIQGGTLRLPPNLHILATMNTSDQSLFPMDSAFKRRWNWKYVPINYTNSIESGSFVIRLSDKEYRWTDFLSQVNERIRKATDSEDKQMGNFFIRGSVDEEEFKGKVMAYLWSEVCKEEYHTQRSFFRVSEQQEFSFNDLYGANGLSLLVGFMEYLSVPCLIGQGGTDGNPDEGV